VRLRVELTGLLHAMMLHRHSKRPWTRGWACALLCSFSPPIIAQHSAMVVSLHDAPLPAVPAGCHLLLLLLQAQQQDPGCGCTTKGGIEIRCGNRGAAGLNHLAAAAAHACSSRVFRPQHSLRNGSSATPRRSVRGTTAQHMPIVPMQAWAGCREPGLNVAHAV